MSDIRLLPTDLRTSKSLTTPVGRRDEDNSVWRPEPAAAYQVHPVKPIDWKDGEACPRYVVNYAVPLKHGNTDDAKEQNRLLQLGRGNRLDCEMLYGHMVCEQAESLRLSNGSHRRSEETWNDCAIRGLWRRNWIEHLDLLLLS